MDPFRVAVVGLGTVGVGTVQILSEQRERIERACGRRVVITAAASRTFRDGVRELLGDCAFESDPVAAAQRDDVDAVVEAIGGAEGAALAVARAAIAAGKHVVTANKALLAVHGNELAAAAEARGVQIRWEAAAGGGVPMVKLLREAAGGDEVRRAVGILNGTCNYILSRMEDEGLPFAQILVDAQRLGYAEADPTLDVGGGDAGHKIALLAATAFGIRVPEVTCSGIADVTPADMQALREFGYRVRLLAVAEKHEDASVTCAVAPYAVPAESALGRTCDVLNALVYECRYAGTLAVRGRGAGRGPTAAATVADICDLARGVRQFTFGCSAASAEPALLRPSVAHFGSYYLRLSVPDRPGVLASLAEAAARHEVSVHTLMQRGRGDHGPVDVVMITHPARESQISAVLHDVAHLCTQTPHPLRIFV